MPIDPITTLTSIKSELEGTWKNFDAIYNTFTSKDWSRKFGKTWTYAEQPYHLAYFDRMFADSVDQGTRVPEAELVLFRTMRELNEWNAREFAKRGPNHTVEDSLRMMHESREAVRSLLATTNEQQLDRKAWFPLFFGWSTAREAFQAIIIHNVAEYLKLWFRTGKKGPTVSPAALHLRLTLMMNFMSKTLDRKEAVGKKFTMVWNFTGPGGGTWTYRVNDGQCIVKKEFAPNPDLTIGMKPETFQKLAAKIQSPPMLMLTGQMKIKGMRAMGTFGKLFPEPKPDQVIEIGAGGAAAG